MTGGAPPPGTRLRACVFDLDGTLLDSIEVIRASVNAVRTRHGAAPHTEDTVRAAIGEGSRVFTGRTLRDLVTPGHSMEALHAEYLTHYLPASVEHARLFDGASELLAFAAGRYRLAILTNKPLDITERIAERLCWGDLFDAIVSPENARAPKPDPAGLLGVLEDLGCAREEALLVGDSYHDFATGRRAGVFTVGVRSGYYTPGVPEPDLWVADLRELQRWLEREAGAARPAEVRP